MRPPVKGPGRMTKNNPKNRNPWSRLPFRGPTTKEEEFTTSTFVSAFCFLWLHFSYQKRFFSETCPITDEYLHSHLSDSLYFLLHVLFLLRKTSFFQIQKFFYLNNYGLLLRNSQLHTLPILNLKHTFKGETK